MWAALACIGGIGRDRGLFYCVNGTSKISRRNSAQQCNKSDIPKTQNLGNPSMERIGHRGIVLFLFLILGSPFAIAQDDQPFKNAKSIAISQNDSVKNCGFFTHNCELCSVGDDGTVSCSSVGFACEPTSWRCLAPSNRERDSKKDER